MNNSLTRVRSAIPVAYELGFTLGIARNVSFYVYFTYMYIAIHIDTQKKYRINSQFPFTRFTVSRHLRPENLFLPNPRQ